VARLKLPYRSRDIPAGVLFLTAGIDVQKNRLVYVIKKSARLEMQTNPLSLCLRPRALIKGLHH
jgi:hypothetical protein